MKTFNEFLTEDAIKPGWRRLSGTEEHDEVNHQLDAHERGDAPVHPSIHKALKHLSDSKNYATAIQRSRTEVYNRQKLKKVENTTGGEGWTSGQKSLDRSKVARANQQAAQQKSGKKTLPMPVIIRAKNRTTGETVEHNLSGNTRLSRHGGAGVPTHVINYEHD